MTGRELRDPIAFGSMFVGEPYPMQLRRARWRRLFDGVGFFLFLGLLVMTFVGGLFMLATAS